MSGLRQHVDEYLRLRRALGFKLREEERVLGGGAFVPRGTTLVKPGHCDR
jgi:hypothetical protein